MPQRRNIAQGLTSSKFAPGQFGGQETLENIKRKKLRREMIFGAKNQSGP
jgi:hypothetical protein